MGQKFELPELNYDYGALSDHISADIMKLHHSKHHQTYVDKLNAAIEQSNVDGDSLVSLLGQVSSLPESIQAAVRNNGGGHYNHSRFWQWMSPDGGSQPSGELGRAIDQAFGSYQGFVDKFSQEALGVFGSGWVWLQPDMTIVTTPNQDNPLMSGGAEPLLGLDVWEHAYYLDYKNKRDDYVAAWWNVVDWQRVEQEFRQPTA